MVRVMVTGANRGIGLELVRRYLARGDRVFATYRETARSRGLIDIAGTHTNLTAVPLEVRDAASLLACLREVSRHVDGMDVLINNAGMGERSVDQGDPDTHNVLGRLRSESLMDVLAVNAVAPVMITQAFLPLLEGGHDPKVAHITSQMGSVARRSHGGDYSYCASKAALNMLGRIMSFDLLPRGIVSAMLHPGWVSTDMGGPDAPLSVEESVDGLVRVIDGLTRADNGRFLDHTGAELPW